MGHFSANSIQDILVSEGKQQISMLSLYEMHSPQMEQVETNMHKCRGKGLEGDIPNG